MMAYLMYIYKYMYIDSCKKKNRMNSKPYIVFARGTFIQNTRKYISCVQYNSIVCACNKANSTQRGVC